MDATIGSTPTAMSASGIGIVRISGEILSWMYREDLSFQKRKKDRYSYSRQIYHSLGGFIYDGEEVVDEVLVMIMRDLLTHIR